MTDSTSVHNPQVADRSCRVNPRRPPFLIINWFFPFYSHLFKWLFLVFLFTITWRSLKMSKIEPFKRETPNMSEAQKFSHDPNVLGSDVQSTVITCLTDFGLFLLQGVLFTPAELGTEHWRARGVLWADITLVGWWVVGGYNQRSCGKMTGH